MVRAGVPLRRSTRAALPVKVAVTTPGTQASPSSRLRWCSRPSSSSAKRSTVDLPVPA